MLYAMEYSRKNRINYVEFENENDMENHWIIWIADSDDVTGVNFFYCDKGYTPDWADE